jgi:hypothetical protein
MWDCIQNLLADPILQAAAKWRYQPPAEGQAIVFNDMISGDWWKHQQEEVGDCDILSVILYCDETSMSFAGKSVYPVYLSLGNLPMHHRTSIAGKRLLGFLPTISAVSAFQDAPELTEYRRKVLDRSFQQ